MSNFQPCFWDETDQSCKEALMDSDYTCSKANKYGCLNTPVYPCGWLESN